MNQHDVNAEERDEDKSCPVQQRDAILQQTCGVTNINIPENTNVIWFLKKVPKFLWLLSLQNISPMWKIPLDPIDAIHSVRKMVQFVNCSVRGLKVNQLDTKNNLHTSMTCPLWAWRGNIPLGIQLLNLSQNTRWTFCYRRS